MNIDMVTLLLFFCTHAVREDYASCVRYTDAPYMDMDCSRLTAEQCAERKGRVCAAKAECLTKLKDGIAKCATPTVEQRGTCQSTQP